MKNYANNEHEKIVLNLTMKGQGRLHKFYINEIC